VKARATAIAIWLVLLIGCNRSPASRGGEGELEVSWSGTERGRFSTGAAAEWCGVLRLLEIHGIRGDTGIALAIFVSDTVTAGEYRVVDPARAESLPPAAALALRWASPTSIIGFQAESGSVVLEQPTSSGLSGRVKAAARSVNDTQKISVEGEFRNLSVRSQIRGCAPRPKPAVEDAEPSDTQLH
jgi:hypothetical protein